MLSLRAAVPEDAAAIAHVHIRSWQTTYQGILPEAFLASLSLPDRTLSWLHWLQLDHLVFVAELDQQIVGFIGGGSTRDSLLTSDAELFAVYLLQTAQRHGIGTALLRTLADSLDDAGFRSLSAWVLEGNTSTRFYQASGATCTAARQIEIGGVSLPALAFLWPDLSILKSACPPRPPSRLTAARPPAEN